MSVHRWSQDQHVMKEPTKRSEMQAIHLPELVVLHGLHGKTAEMVWFKRSTSGTQHADCLIWFATLRPRLGARARQITALL